MSGALSATMSGLTGPFVAVIARDTLQATDLQIAILSMSGVAGHLMAIYWAKLLEGRRKMRFAVTAFSIARVPLLFVCLADTHWKFIGLIIAMNLVSSAASPAYSALMREIYPDSDRAKIMGYVRVLNWAVIIAVTALASWLLGVVSYRIIFPIAGVVGIAGAIVFGRIPSKDASGDSDVSHVQFLRDSISILRDNPPFRWFCAGVFMFGFANFVALPLWTIYQVDVLGVRTQWAGVYSVTVQIATMVSFFYWGPFIDRTRPEKTIVAITAMSVCVPLVYCLSSSPWMLLPAMPIWGIICGGSELSYMKGVLYYAPADKAAQYHALFLFLMGVRGIVAPYIGTALLQYKLLTIKEVFMLHAALLLVAVLVQLVGIRRYGGDQPKTSPAG